MAKAPPVNNSSQTQPPSLSVDWEQYTDYLDDSDLSNKQKQEFIQILWNIVVSFVDLGFDVHAPDAPCEQIAENTLILPDDLVSSLNNVPDNTIEEMSAHGSALHGTKEES